MAAIHELLRQISDDTLRNRLANEIKKLEQKKKFGLVFEEHLPECTPLHQRPIRVGSHVAKKTGRIVDIYTVVSVMGKNAVCQPIAANESEIIPLQELVMVATFGDAIFPSLESLGKVKNAPESGLWHTLIEADNYHALQLLEYLYPQKVDCIYIDPPYNTGAKDWKYNNDYVDGSDAYRHSKWLSMMQKRLELAKKLLNPVDSVLIVMIDEKEYLHLGCLLEELFPETEMQMVSSAINGKGVSRGNEFARVNEYAFIVRIGKCSVNAMQLSPEWTGNIKTTTTNKVRWGSLMRSGTGSAREDSPGCFYPIYISDDKTKFMGVGEPLPIGVSRYTVKTPPGQIALWPVHADGKEGRWQYGKDNFEVIKNKGYVRISTQTNRGEATLRYISEGWQKKVEDGTIKVIGKADDGSLLFDDDEYQKSFIPGNQWWIPSHDATEFGSKELNKIIGKRFSFPKSLYAVHDTVRFFVANKPNALIVDFFAGSGTTLHAVNLLNAEDGGNRRCILVTNNEVSESEAKKLTKEGHQPGDEKWEHLGIARYVTWPRTVCSIKGHDVNGNPLKGNYLGSDRPMNEGFPANAEYFKLGFLDKDSVSLGAQFREILPLLWLKAGAVGERPELPGEDELSMLILPKNDFAVLLDEGCFGEFMDKLGEIPKLSTIYLVTDSEDLFRSMAGQLGEVDAYQLYRDYIDNFVLGARNRGNEA